MNFDSDVVKKCKLETESPLRKKIHIQTLRFLLIFDYAACLY
jgi:hypothetical protein